VAQVNWEDRLGGRVPLATPLVDHEGRTVTLGDCLGERPAILALVYYECPMLCDLVLEGLVKSLKGVALEPGRDFDLVAISIDPAETPELAAGKRASALARYGLASDDPRAAAWRFLVGGAADVRAIADAVGFGYELVPETGEWAHPAGVTVLTDGGVVARVLQGVEFAPRDLRLALVEASDGSVGTWVDQALLLCFHYDPTRGRYGLAILWIVRGLSTLTCLVLGGFVVHWLRRERRARAPAWAGGEG
jgi:protein SCO1/2